jgi:DNA (cytosine-5)-methyltransferase 1
MIPQAALPALPSIDDAEGTGVIERIDELLHVTYREADLGNFRDPLEEAIYILLSRQTREAAYQHAYRELRRNWPTWRALASAPPAEIVEIIAPAGFGPSRAEQIQSLLGAVARECHTRGLGGRITLDWLRELDDADATAFLLSLPGIGPKSARCILHYSLDRDTFAVDTNVRRTFHRLGLVEDRGGKVAHAEYEDLVAPRMRRRLHVNLIHHGRQRCRSRTPLCADCPLISFCATGRATLEGDSRPTVVELFGGAGGLGLGFKRAGFRIAVAVELDRAAAQTYRANHRGTVVVERDVRGVTGDAIRAAFPLLGDVSAVIGGPPCQGYSAAGKRDPEHHKNDLFREQVRIASELDARFVVIENVPGMRGVSGVQFVDKVENALREAGYHPNAGIVRASDYDVPQLRARLIFTAQKLDRGDAPPIPIGGYCGSLLPECRCGRPPTHRDPGAAKDPDAEGR